MLELEWRPTRVDRPLAAGEQEGSAATPAPTEGAAQAADDRRRVTLKASVTGLVSRCHVRVGDAVCRGGAVVSVLRADDVLVVARFDAAEAPRLRRARTAWVHVPSAGAYCMPARIIRIGGADPSPREPWSRRDAGAVRVIAQLSSASFEALSPGIEAAVEISGFDEAP